MVSLLIACLLSASPNQIALVDHVDIIEINNLYDNQGRLIIRQVIFWDWSPSDARHQVRAWRLLKTAQQLPRMNWRSGRYEARWRDQNDMRFVTAGDTRETWTTYDPEVLERTILPIERRLELSIQPQRFDLCP